MFLAIMSSKIILEKNEKFPLFNVKELFIMSTSFRYSKSVINKLSIRSSFSSVKYLAIGNAPILSLPYHKPYILYSDMTF